MQAATTKVMGTRATAAKATAAETANANRLGPDASGKSRFGLRPRLRPAASQDRPSAGVLSESRFGLRPRLRLLGRRRAVSAVGAVIGLSLAALSCGSSGDGGAAGGESGSTAAATTAPPSDEVLWAPAEPEAGTYAMEMGDVSADDAAGAIAPATTAPLGSARVGACSGCGPDIFLDYGDNPVVDASEDPFSTFALDVDTASYVVARNHLEGGRLPPPEAVRVEEFVNYFDGGYRPVLDELLVDIDAAPSPFSDAGQVLVRVGVQAPDALSDVVIPQTVVLVMDRSGSMGEWAGPDSEPIERMALAHRAVDFLVSGLPDSARVGVVAYDNNADIILEPTEIGGNRDEIMGEIRRRVAPGGSTNAEAGLTRGYEMARREADQDRSVLVLLLSDGVANVGATRTDDILEEIGERSDIGLSTVGVGLGPFNDVLMEQLANRADGTYHYIDSPDEARRIFVDDLGSLLSLAARDARIQVAFDPETVWSYRLLGFENRAIEDEDFRDDTRDAGEVGLGQSSTALYEVALAGGGSGLGPSDPVAVATLRYQRPRSGTVSEVTARLEVADIAPAFESAAPHFRLAAVAAELAETLGGSPFADTGMLDLAKAAISVAESLPEDPDTEELLDLILTVRQIGGDTTGIG